MYSLERIRGMRKCAMVLYSCIYDFKAWHYHPTVEKYSHTVLTTRFGCAKVSSQSIWFNARAGVSISGTKSGSHAASVRLPTRGLARICATPTSLRSMFDQIRMRTIWQACVVIRTPVSMFCVVDGAKTQESAGAVILHIHLVVGKEKKLRFSYDI